MKGLHMMKYSIAPGALMLSTFLSLAACAGASPGGRQSCAGINEVNISYTPASGQMEARLCGGKENESVKLSGAAPNGLAFEYEAEESKAFAGQITRAEMQQALSRERGETIRQLIDALRHLPAFIPAPAR
jgi:hypothetical protein